MDYILYCKIYKNFFENCIEINKEVFGDSHDNFCVKYIKAIELYCKN